MNADDDNQWLSIQEAVALTGVSDKTIARRARDGLVARQGSGTRGIRYSLADLTRLRRAFGGRGET